MSTTTENKSDYLDRDTFFQNSGRRYLDVELPNGGKIRIQSLTEKERSQWENDSLDKKLRGSKAKIVDMRARLIIKCAVDPDGKRLFDNHDVDKICAMDSVITNKIYEAITDHVGIGEQDEDELVKNSERIHGDDSP